MVVDGDVVNFAGHIFTMFNDNFHPYYLTKTLRFVYIGCRWGRRMF